MTDVLHIGGLEFRVKRSPRRKTVGVTVERDRSLSVHVPEAADIDRISKIVESRLVWVHQKLLTLPDSPKRQPVFRRKEYIDGEGFHFLGQHYRLRLVDKDSQVPATLPVYLDGDHLCLRRDFVDDAERQVVKFYTREAYPYLNGRTACWKRRMGVEPQRFVNVQDLGYRWGSCSADGTLNFHWRTIQLPPAVIDYVVVHELAHLKVPAHSPAFWAVLAEIMPGYTRHREWLKSEAVYL